jgi:hypothetical protein
MALALRPTFLFALAAVHAPDTVVQWLPGTVLKQQAIAPSKPTNRGTSFYQRAALGSAIDIVLQMRQNKAASAVSVISLKSPTATTAQSVNCRHLEIVRGAMMLLESEFGVVRYNACRGPRAVYIYKY